MKFIIITLFAFFFSNISAQEYQYTSFPDSNAVWSEVYWKSYFDPPPRYIYNQYALFNEDTVINGRIYHKLFHTNSTDKITRENSICIGGIREDSLKRIIVNSSLFKLVPEVKEVILFDFSLNEGDTIWQYQANDTIVTNMTSYKLVVNDIDTLSINNSKRKVISFNIPWTHWIEGIGSVQGLIFPSGDLRTDGTSNDLVCMHQNDTLLYYYPGTEEIPYDDCAPWFVIDGVSILANPDIKVYPNPVNGEVVYFENLDFETLELFDLNGNLVREETIKGLNVFELKIPCISSGVYTYRLTTKGLVPTQGKLVVL